MVSLDARQKHASTAPHRQCPTRSIGGPPGAALHTVGASVRSLTLLDLLAQFPFAGNALIDSRDAAIRSQQFSDFRHGLHIALIALSSARL